MADDRIDNLVDHIEKTALAFGREATAMSDRIVKLEKRLRQLPGKDTVEVQRDGVGLSFDGTDSSEWYLWFWDDESEKDEDGDTVWSPLTSGAVERKVRAVALVPELLKELAAAQSKRLEPLQRSLGRANTVLREVLSEEEDD